MLHDLFGMGDEVLTRAHHVLDRERHGDVADHVQADLPGGRDDRIEKVAPAFLCE